MINSRQADSLTHPLYDTSAQHQSDIKEADINSIKDDHENTRELRRLFTENQGLKKLLEEKDVTVRELGYCLLLFYAYVNLFQLSYSLNIFDILASITFSQ